MGSVVTYHFAARGKKPPVTLKWYEKGYEVPKPTRWQKDKDLPSGGGMYMEGTKENPLSFGYAAQQSHGYSGRTLHGNEK